MQSTQIMVINDTFYDVKFDCTLLEYTTIIMIVRIVLINFIKLHITFKVKKNTHGSSTPIVLLQFLRCIRIEFSNI